MFSVFATVSVLVLAGDWAPCFGAGNGQAHADRTSLESMAKRNG